MSMIAPARINTERLENRVLLYKKPLCCQENIGLLKNIRLRSNTCRRMRNDTAQIAYPHQPKSEAMAISSESSSRRQRINMDVWLRLVTVDGTKDPERQYLRFSPVSTTFTSMVIFTLRQLTVNSSITWN